jgi:hypothetical protein
MLIEIIASSLSAIASVSTLLQNRQREQTPTEAEFVQLIRARIFELEMELLKARRLGEQASPLLGSYHKLLDAIRSSNLYSSRLEFRPTDHGTWILIRRKSTVLRDPEGEY